MSRQRRQPPEYNWPDIKAVLLYSTGCTLAEVSRHCGGISRKHLSARLKRLGCEIRPSGGRGVVYPSWQRRLIRRVREMGLSLTETAHLFSVSISTVARCCSDISPAEWQHLSSGGRPSKNLGGFRVPLVCRAWNDCRRYILAAAQLDGATYQELSDLAGWAGTWRSAVALNPLKRQQQVRA